VPSTGAAWAAGEVELGFIVNLETLASRVSVTAPPGVLEVAGDPLNVGIVWDAENRLTEVRQGPTTLASFVYDGRGRRQQKVAGGVTHTYVSDKDSLLEERVSTGQTLRYVEGSATDQHLAMQDGAAVTYYVANHLGSVVQATNSIGAVTLMRKYDPWGNILSGAGSAGWAFTGREWDPEAGLAYYRARYYDPSSGRFISEDPIGLRGGMHRFAYVRNAPTVATDPFGLKADDSLRVPHAQYYICCYRGQLSICRGGAQVPEDQCLRKCSLDHENSHVQDMRPKPCQKNPCQGVPDLTPVTLPQTEADQTECRAHTDTWECIKKCRSSDEKTGMAWMVRSKMMQHCGYPPTE